MTFRAVKAVASLAAVFVLAGCAASASVANVPAEGTTPSPTPTATLAQPTSTPKAIPISEPTATPAEQTGSTEPTPAPTATFTPTPLATAGAVSLTAPPILTPTATPTPSPTPTPAPTATPTLIAVTPRYTNEDASQFVVLDDPAVISASQATYLSADSLVLGYADGTDARAYPVDMMWYHHIANDTVGGRPITVTY